MKRTKKLDHVVRRDRRTRPRRLGASPGQQPPPPSHRPPRRPLERSTQSASAAAPASASARPVAVRVPSVPRRIRLRPVDLASRGPARLQQPSRDRRRRSRSTGSAFGAGGWYHLHRGVLERLLGRRRLIVDTTSPDRGRPQTRHRLRAGALGPRVRHAERRPVRPRRARVPLWRYRGGGTNSAWAASRPARSASRTSSGKNRFLVGRRPTWLGIPRGIPSLFFVGRQPKRHASLRARAPGVFMCSRRRGLRGDETEAGDRRRWRHGRGRHRGHGVRPRRDDRHRRRHLRRWLDRQRRDRSLRAIGVLHAARGQYCGLIGNGCPGGKLDCGTTCATDGTCEMNQCVGGASVCTPLTCGTYCGEIGDGCGRKLKLQHLRRGARVPRRPLRRSGLRPDHLRGREQRALLRHRRRRLRRHARMRHLPERRHLRRRRLRRRTSATTRPARRSRARRWAASTAAPSATAAAARRTAARARTAWRARRPAPALHICPGSTTTTTPTCTGATKTTDQRHGLRPGRRQPALQRHRLRPERRRCPRSPRASAATSAARRSSAPLASALTDVNGHFSMTLEPVPPRPTSRSSFRSASGAGRSRSRRCTTCEDNPLTDKEPDAAAAHQRRGPHPADRGDDRRRRRARVPAPPHRHRRHRVHQRRGRRPRPPLRWRQGHEQPYGRRHAERRDDAVGQPHEAREVRRHAAVVRGQHERVPRA